MAGPNFDLHGAAGDPEQEQRWRTEDYARARAERVREVVRRPPKPQGDRPRLS